MGLLFHHSFYTPSKAYILLLWKEVAIAKKQPQSKNKWYVIKKLKY